MNGELFKRPQMTEDEVDRAIDFFRETLANKLKEKGWGAFISSHEILGHLGEEGHELTEAIEANRLDRVVMELMDVAVVCVFGAGCILAEKVDS